MDHHELGPGGNSPPAKRAKLGSTTSETASKPGQGTKRTQPHDGANDPKKPRKERRPYCRKCIGCLVKVDCGTCINCKKKKKFGGDGKQKGRCIKRQCQELKSGPKNKTNEKEPSCSQSLQTTGGGGEGWVGPQGVNSRPPMIGSNQLGISPFQYNLNTPTLQGGGNKSDQQPLTHPSELEPHGSVASPSTSQLQPQEATQPGSSAQQTGDSFMHACKNCHMYVETRYHCRECDDFDLCVACYRDLGHIHPMDKLGLGLDDEIQQDTAQKDPREQRKASIQKCIQFLVHASQCRDPMCKQPSCIKMKRVLRHTRDCKLRQSGNCTICKQFLLLCYSHAKICTDDKCSVPICARIKKNLREHKQNNEPVETEDTHTSTSTRPKQQPFKTESMLLFEQAMKEGYIEVSIIKCLLLGTAGVGKTCLLHLLLGMLPPHLRQSTACIEQAIRAVCMKYGINSQGEWQKVDSDGLRDHLAGSVLKVADADVPLVPASEASLHIDKEGEATAFAGSGSYTMGDIVKRLEEKPGLGRLQDMTWVYLVDSGGQPQFHELLTAFFRNAVIGIFVHKLSERLDDHPHVRYFDKKGEQCGAGYRSPFSNRNIFQHCIQTVQSLPYTTDESIYPNLAVVGTFRDEEHLCTGESRNEKNRQLREILCPILGNVLFRTGLEEVIFPVNAVSPTPEEKDIAKKLKQKIESLKPLPEKLPLKWYGLELELEKEAAQRNRWVFTWDECLQVAKRLHFPSDEALDAALVHLDRLNIFLYYPSVLPELVFCSPCVLLDKISELVEESYRLKHGPDPNFLVEGRLSTFCNKGLITAQLLGDYPKHYTEFFTQAHLLKLFESLLIVAPIDHDTYFMPSLLDVLKQSDFQRPSCGHPLVISFKDRYAPLGLFSSLVAFLLSKPNSWVVADNPKLYRNHITFDHLGDSYPGSVVLIDSATFFEVYLECEGVPEFYNDICRFVSCIIEKGLNAAIEARNFQNVCYHKAISCPCEESWRALHPALPRTCSGTQIWQCTKKPKVCGRLDERHHVWVKNYTETSRAGEETSCHTVNRRLPVTGEGSKDQAEASITDELQHNQGQHCNVDGTQLVKDSLRAILDSISTLTAEWFKLGVALGLSYDTLKTIESNHRGDAHRCLTEMVIAWLQMKDNSEPSWQSLASALSSPSVGRVEIATMIAEEHPSHC